MATEQEMTFSVDESNVVLQRILQDVDFLPQMIHTAEELGINIYVCEMSMEIMGMKRGEIIDYKGLRFAGAGKFLQEAAGAEINLFI